MDINFKIYSERDKNELKRRYEEIFEYINYMLISHSSKLAFFGYFYMNLNKKVVLKDDIKIWKSEKNIREGIVYIYDDELVVVADTEDIYNKEYIFKLLYYILHEILHVVLKHHQRLRNDSFKDSFLFNISSDQIVNTIIKDLQNNSSVTNVKYLPENEFLIKRYIDKKPSLDGFYDILKNSNEFVVSCKKLKLKLNNENELNPSEENFDKYKNCSEDLENKQDLIVEDILDKEDIINNFKTNINIQKREIKDLLLNYNKTEFSSENFLKELKGETKKVDSEFSEEIEFNSNDDVNNLINNIKYDLEDEYLEYVLIEVYDRVDKKSYSIVYNVSKNNKNNKFIDENEEKGPIIFLKYKENLNQAFNSSQNGNITSNGFEYLDKFFKVSYPWDKILQDIINIRSIKTEEYSFCKPNIKKMNLYNSFNIPVSGQITKQIANVIIFAVDTSGSMSSNQIQKIANIIRSCYGKYSEIIILTHDTIITEEIIIKKTNTEKDIEQYLKSFKGRGGTSHKHVFEKIEQYVKEKEVSTIMFFTDYYSDVPTIYKNFNFIKKFKTFWGIFGQNNNKKFDLNLENISSEVIIIED